MALRRTDASSAVTGISQRIGLAGRWQRISERAGLAALLKRIPGRNELLVGVAMAASCLAVYFPYRSDMDVVYRYWDGPCYLVVARTLYFVPASQPLPNLTPGYFACHQPLYPLLIRACSWLTWGDFLTAMLLATVLSSVAAAVLFYRLLAEEKLVQSPLWTALLFSVLPPRWLIYHSVGASEPIFLCCVFAAFLAWRRGRTGWMVLFVGLTALARMVGVLLIPIFMAAHAWRRDWRGAALMPLAGAGVAALFGFFGYVYGDPLVYFHEMARFQHMRAWPFEVYQALAGNGLVYPTEMHFGMYVIYALGTLALWERRELFVYCAVFFVFICFVWHDDLNRYFLVTAPFALLVGFDSVLGRPRCRLALPLILYLVYLYAWGVLPGNGVGEEPFRRLVDFLARP